MLHRRSWLSVLDLVHNRSLSAVVAVVCLQRSLKLRFAVVVVVVVHCCSRGGVCCCSCGSPL